MATEYITIPGRPIRVPVSRVQGEGGDFSHEITLKDKALLPVERRILRSGGRIFYSDDMPTAILPSLWDKIRTLPRRLLTR